MQPLLPEINSFPFQRVRLDLPSDVVNCDGFTQWPEVTEYHTLFPRSPLPFVGCSAAEVKRAGGYDHFIEQYQAIPTRGENWHDFYNGLTWHLFPRSKQALHRSQLHYRCEGHEENRSPQQDGMTLFDENGCIVLTCASWVQEYICGHHWKALFFERRAELEETSRVLTFGHSLFERYQTPYVGLTGKAVIASVDREILALSNEHLYLWLDDWLSNRFPLFPKDLQPLPILGWPGWWPARQTAQFYEDQWYFRPKRRTKP